MRKKLFLYNNGPRAEVIFTRALYREILRLNRFSLTVGVCKDDAYLLADLCAEGLTLGVSDYNNSVDGAIVDLAHLCPPDHLKANIGFQEYGDTWTCQWESLVKVCRRKMAELLPGFTLEYEEDSIPMIDFMVEEPRTVLNRPTVYLDNTLTRSTHSHFLFDLDRLARTFPDFDFLCTAQPDMQLDNILDYSNCNLVQLSQLSNACALLLGMTRDPFCVTMTNANRFKPKAICGYDARICDTFWDYPGSPLEFLGTMDEVMDFVSANLLVRV